MRKTLNSALKSEKKFRAGARRGQVRLRCLFCNRFFYKLKQPHFQKAGDAPA